MSGLCDVGRKLEQSVRHVPHRDSTGFREDLGRRRASRSKLRTDLLNLARSWRTVGLANRNFAFRLVSSCAARELGAHWCHRLLLEQAPERAPDGDWAVSGLEIARSIGQAEGCGPIALFGRFETQSRMTLGRVRITFDSGQPIGRAMPVRRTRRPLWPARACAHETTSGHTAAVAGGRTRWANRNRSSDSGQRRKRTERHRDS